jgi:hypothetical protein
MSKQKMNSATTTHSVALMEPVKVAKADTTPYAYQHAYEADTTQQPCRNHGGVSFEEAVKVRAYQLWERAGRPEGDGISFWLEAEADLRAVQ